MAKMEILIQLALRTFKFHRKKITPECSVVDLNELKSITDEITVNDVNRLKNMLRTNEWKDILKMKKTSIDYLPVYEDNRVTVGVFLLREGAKLPIHDHPGMYGIIKVLQGILKVTSYSLVEIDKQITNTSASMFYNHGLKVIKHPEVLLSNKDACCLLTPTEKNIHEVECLEGPVAFLDILSPPYEDGGSDVPRACHYFEELSDEKISENVKNDYLTLVQVPGPY